MKRLFTIVIFASFVLSSCHFMQDKVRGNGVIKTETRSPNVFNSIEVGGNFDVFVKQDSAYSVRIETDENLMEYIRVSNDGGTLIIEPGEHKNLSGTKGIKIYVSAPVFKELEASGASSISSESKLTSTDMISVDLSGASDATIELQAPKVSTEISGASSIKLKGQTKDLSIEGTGASHAKCFDLLTENADVDVSGASSADIFASVSIKADASGASHVRYKGNASANNSSSGAGSVKKVE